MQNPTIIILFLTLISWISSHTQASDNVVIQQIPKAGLFSLPGSQQPGALVSLSGYIYDEGTIQAFLGSSRPVGQQYRHLQVTPSFMYAFSNDASIYLSAPIAANYHTHGHHSSGWADASTQLSYAYYNDTTVDYTEQAALLAIVSFPTGSPKKNPATGLGSYAFTLATNYTRTYVDWFIFATPGVVLTTKRHHLKPGNQFLYQAGIGRNIVGVPDELIVSALIEMDGTSTAKEIVHGIKKTNTGGNVISITPSIWVSTPHMIFPFGVSMPMVQHLFGQQNKSKYTLVANLGWTF